MRTLRQNLANLISVPYTFVRLSLMKLIYPKNLFYTPLERFSPNVVVAIDRKSEMHFGNRVSIHSRARLSANSGGKLTINCNSSFNVGCIITCRYRIEIGENISCGQNVMMFDHDHIMGGARGVKDTGYSFGEIVIGDNTWIGAGVIILAGTHIGKNCIIAAGSVVKGNVPDNTVLIQKRETVYKDVKYN